MKVCKFYKHVLLVIKRVNEAVMKNTPAKCSYSPLYSCRVVAP